MGEHAQIFSLGALCARVPRRPGNLARAAWRDLFAISPDYAIVSATEAGEGNVLLVNAWHPLPEDYQPAALVNLYEQRHSFLLASSEIWLEKTAYEAAEAMFPQAEEGWVNGFIITSGYRTRAGAGGNLCPDHRWNRRSARHQRARDGPRLRCNRAARQRRL